MFTRFGYLSYNGSDIHADDDVFDDHLERAIRAFQVNYHLNVTGALDNDTASQMMQPRCGVPDIINGTNTMARHLITASSHGHRSHGLHIVGHYSFFSGMPKWPPSKHVLSYAFLAGTPTAARAPVARAFQTWASATFFRFYEVSNYAFADLKVAFYQGDHGDGSPFDGPGGVIAHAFAPTQGWFHYDADEAYSVGAVSGRFDYQTVALHEIGHLLGLGHSQVANAIMYPLISSGTTKGLNADDIQGIRALYGI
ncbi:hypothetical protein SAY87_025151 [Trapa incisa]|uniref:Peptidase metallopeptidase domain-containing protein n=1 Tax=Trapa incisa TaxID=236973 RepID=A0AAN7JGH7_9MYRT|nr:hypothetical protein SAY87_025151 [Trapa incisa]